MVKVVKDQNLKLTNRLLLSSDIEERIPVLNFR